MKAGAWKYDIVTDGFKSNMTDIMAAIGLVQLTRYDEMIEKRRALFNVYSEILSKHDWAIIPPSKTEDTETCYHLYTLRLRDCTESKRDEVIQKLAEKDIAANVHFTPLPMFTLYKNLGYKIEDYPNAYAQYANEISLPLYSTLTLEDLAYVANELVKLI